MIHLTKPPLKASILIVDDAPAHLRLLTKILTSQGYQVRQAINGKLALQGAQIFKPDLILLDINMPEMTGYEVCKKLKSLEITRQIPVIFLSAYSETIDKVKAFQVGGVDYITKPFQIEEVLARVENQLTLHHMQQQLCKQNARLQLEIIERQRAEEEVRFLLTTTKLINESLDFHNALEITLRQVGQTIGWDLGEAWIPNNETATLEYSRGWYASEQKFEKFIEASKNLILSPNIGIAGHVWLSQKLEWIEDISLPQETWFIRSEIALEVGLKAALSIPIIINNQILAILVFFKKERIKPEARIIELVKAVATQLGSFIQRKKIEAALVKANQELERIATLDGLTGIANRRRFDEYLYFEWLRLFREKLPLSLILADVDFFKLYNDTYGHLAGDFCLQHVAAALRHSVKRHSDLVARYGGEEFAVILPNTTAKGAFYVAETIRKHVQRIKLVHAKSEVSKYVTLSLGIASIIPNAELCPDTLITIADKALYAAKNKGRNCVVVEDLASFQRKCHTEISLPESPVHSIQ
jgi:two-component system, cell cycle response regulator